MKKSNILGGMIHLIILAMFNALYFGINGIDYPVSAWIAYGFIHFAYLMIIVTPYITQKGKDSATYAASMYTITSTYFFVELLLGGIIIIVSPESYKFSLFSQLILCGIYLILLFSNMIADEHTAKAVEKYEAELRYVKESCSVLQSIMGDISDKQLYRQVEKAHDLIQSSPAVSNASVRGIERQVINEIDVLANAVRNGDAAEIAQTTDKIIRLANERNRLLRLAN